jgi:hypothetical protein
MLGHKVDPIRQDCMKYRAQPGHFYVPDMANPMLLAHKIALDPNVAQRLYFVQGAGTARFAFNWALDEWKRRVPR